MNIDYIIEYFNKNGIKIVVDNNPSPNKIKRIEKRIKEKENFEKLFIKRYKEDI